MNTTISRRTILSFLGLFGLSLKPAVGKYMADPHPVTEDKETLPPHNEALLMVWRTQQDAICKLELGHAVSEQKKQKEYVASAERWWFDTEGRQWRVKRPFDPGFIDSTHWFFVDYVIEGKTVASWSVDTRKKTVDIRKL